MIKVSIQQENTTIVNIYVPNIGAPKYIKQSLTNMKAKIDNNAIRVGDFNTHAQKWIDLPDRKSVKK